MTLLVEAPATAREVPDEVTVVIRPPAAPAITAPIQKPSTGRLRTMLALWLAATVVAFGLVLYGFGPMFHDRAQRHLLADYRTAIDQAANEGSGLAGVTVATQAPELGEPVAILEIGDVRLQQVVVEGAGSSQTSVGPGHVPGTAGPGQPGNSVVVARRDAFGGPFRDLGQLRRGDPIVVSTTQGQSVYEVTVVKRTTLRHSPADAGQPDQDQIDALYGPSEGDQLTLVTSASSRPSNKDRALVVIAEMQDQPFEPTPQGGRSDGQTGTTGDHGARAAGVLAILVYGATLGAAVVLYRRLGTRTAYLVTVGPVLAMTVVAAETVGRLLPAWM